VPCNVFLNAKFSQKRNFLILKKICQKSKGFGLGSPKPGRLALVGHQITTIVFIFLNNLTFHVAI
jgi:hypothetical protein